MEAIKKSLREEYKPVLDERDRLRTTSAASSIVEAARRAGVKDEFLNAIQPGSPPIVVQQVMPSLKYVEELGYHAAKLGEGFYPVSIDG